MEMAHSALVLITFRLCWPLSGSHSKWIEAYPTNSATSTVVIELLRTSFARFGIPETIVTDNGPCFVSEEIEMYFQMNGIKHITSAPFKWTCRMSSTSSQEGLEKVTLTSQIAKVLFSYQITPQTTTGVSPSQLLLGRQPRSRLDLLIPQQLQNILMMVELDHEILQWERLFQLPIEHEGKEAGYWSLSKDAQKVMKTTLRSLKLLVIDEVSMVSSLNLTYVHMRMQEIFGEDHWFGGKNVLFVGDLLQLQPVNGNPVFEKNE